SFGPSGLKSCVPLAQEKVSEKTLLSQLGLFARAFRANQNNACHALALQAFHIPARANGLMGVRGQPAVAIPTITNARGADHPQGFSYVHADLPKNDRPPGDPGWPASPFVLDSIQSVFLPRLHSNCVGYEHPLVEPQFMQR